MKTQQNRMAIFGVVKRGEGSKGFWTRIGTAFVNKDGSFNLKFDYLPSNLAETTIQVRTAERNEATGAEGAEAGEGASA